MRLVKGLAALVALVVLAAGIPTALILLGGNPLPAHLSWAAARAALLRRDDGTVLMGLITLVGWIAWLVFALSLLSELVAMVSRWRIRITLPGFAGPQRLVAGLLLAVTAMVALPVQISYGAPTPATPLSAPGVGSPSGAVQGVTEPAARQEQPSPRAAERSSVTSGQTGAHPVTHRVQRGDDLWSLAKRYYGHGLDWRKIAAANPELLTGGPDRLQPGWQLTIPDLGLVERPSGSDLVTVRVGDSLTSIAERRYGEQTRWQDIFEANRDQLEDPDEIQAGTQLRLPNLAQPPLPQSTPRPPSHGNSGNGRPTARAQHEHNQGPDRQESSTPELSGPKESSAPKESAPPRETGRPPSAAPSTSSEPVTTSSPAATTTPQPTLPRAEEQARRGIDEPGDGVAEAALGIGAVGGLLAAAVLGGLAVRRRVQLQKRPVGRRIPHPSAPAQALETALGHRQQLVSLRTLDIALRAIAAHCLHVSAPLPALTLAKVGPQALELLFDTASPDAPVGFLASGRTWRLEQSDADYLSSVPGITEAARPYPALTTLGRDDVGNQLLVDLEAAGLMSLDADDPSLSAAVLAALAVELSFSPWADELVLTMVGSSEQLPDALGKHHLSQTDDLSGLLSRLEQRAETQRAHQDHRVLGQHRIDPDLAEPWVPEIVLIGRQLTEEQTRRLVALVTTEPRVPTAAVVLGPLEAARWALQVTRAPGASALPAAPAPVTAVLRPLGLTLEPQLLEASAAVTMVELVSATGADATTPAPWWDHDGDLPADPSPDHVVQLGRRFGGWGSDAQDTRELDPTAQEPEAVVATAKLPPPVLRLLGPIELVGASGPPPPRAGRQCLEYCGWLLQNPGTTAQAMASALVVAEGTRRSNMSRLRSWLGRNTNGEAYLPDAYTGHIVLHPSVTSDWQRLQILTASGVNRTSTPGLRAALELLRGAPLADAAPGQWHWAEELRTDMISAIRDIGVELAERALAAQDIDLARWAAARALAAAPGDELLMAVRIRTEHQAGNVAETERLTLQLAAQARALGVDLDDETVTLLQEVMEGQVRARLA